MEKTIEDKGSLEKLQDKRSNEKNKRDPRQYSKIAVENYDNLDVLQLVGKLDQEIGIENVTEFKNWFGERHFLVNYPFKYKNFNRIFLIKYIDGLCKLWKPKWARQCRGVVIYKANDGKIYCLKMLLQRGAELLTKMHQSLEISSTQDIDEINKDDTEKTTKITLPSIEKFDLIQQDNLIKFRTGGDINGALSFKVDGSLLGVVLLSKQSEIYNEICEIFELHLDEFHKELKNLSERLNLPFLPIFASQGTSFIGPDMYDYTLTSIICDFGKMPYEELKQIALVKKPYVLFQENNQELINFFKSLQIFFEKINCEENISLSFETVCPNRKQAWEGGLNHANALTVNYPSAQFRFLGATLNHGITTGNYMAHFQIEELVNTVGWDQPLYWEINHTKQVDNLLSDLDRVIEGELTNVEYLKIHPPNNKYQCAVDINESIYLDFEGFVFYRFLENNKLDYSKIKTSSYYFTHHPKRSNIKHIIKFSEEAEKIFPNCIAAKNIYHNFDSSLLKFFDKMADDIVENEKLYLKTFSESDLIKYEKLHEETKKKMLISSKNEKHDLRANTFKYACEYIGKFSEDAHIKKTLLTACMVYGIWEDKNKRSHEEKYQNFKNDKAHDSIVSTLIDDLLYPK